MIIEQKIADSVSRDKNYFFGLYDMNWEWFIIRLLSTKMDKLLIENIAYAGYMSRDSADVLREVSDYCANREQV